MEFRIIYLPPFKAASSAVDKNFDFSEDGILGKFDKYFSAIIPSARDDFMPRDFLFFDEENQGMVWWWALSEDMEDGGNKVVNFEGGHYLTYAYRDGDEETNGKLYNEAVEYIKNSGIFELDVRPNHYAMGHIITPKEIIAAQGWAQMETFIPIRLK
ncbi:hypothetical protein [Anaerocolumna sp.]|uniref:hypothetical protein n=1 Tax=Anaerocolumna sp. TaxID=2041569 RepID=UPI0028A89E28|nr:hypothetical protein [Anaerocolumna sp.]